MYNFKHDILSDAETNDLLLQAQEGSETAIEQLVEGHVRLVGHAAQRYYHPGYEADDFIQMGMVALLKAIRDYDTKKKVKFSSYVVTKVNGEISTWLREHRHTMRIPRNVSVAIQKIHSKALTESTIEEISAALDTDDIECIETALQIIHNPLLSIDKLLEGEKKDMVIELSGDVNGEWLQVIEIEEILNRLDSRSKEIIKLKYWYSLVNREIAPIFGVSGAQISRLETAALAQLRKEIEKERLIHS
ncbi:putative RNA polymerase sigma 28 subunit SigG [Bacillus phage BCP78]|uniref:RNA polymerase sporulation specific sigma factor SigG n=3 Tax=Tsarbombavirus BCP78 TaxID=1985182 RepID=A0A2S0CSN0_9CAUD|nr:RNA polymerase sigma factor [Bacillus phage BCP78]YP_009783472.1 putative RNA polymerase sigma 28 subunit SigG [Bacillus phage BCU4]AEW47116.1 putative RNA polymerase sigma 28 subunit SigG [Bacillus phage BCP78]AEW47605.1 putative RNA polymerase sigma 28 subunit SigG [Bacillus phage BCU4]AQN32487.1 RNA polymerase sporulation specific sigma factor SigG [Bacillus phage BCP12]